MPPTQRPLRLEAAILSRMRSEVTSRSNWAKESSTLSVSRPIEVVVLNCWVTETKDTWCRSKTSTMRAKSMSDRVTRSSLYTATTSTRPDILKKVKKFLQCGSFNRAAGKAAIVIVVSNEKV